MGRACDPGCPYWEDNAVGNIILALFFVGLLVVILIFRPQGLLGRPVVAKV